MAVKVALVITQVKLLLAMADVITGAVVFCTTATTLVLVQPFNGLVTISV